MITLRDVEVFIFAKTKTTIQADIILDFINNISIDANVTVFEQGNHYYQDFDFDLIIKDKPFNFNKFCNDAFKMSSKKVIVFCNSDLETISNNWLEELIKEMNNGSKVVSSHDPKDPRQKHFTTNQKGYVCGKHFSGWCFAVHRDVWENIGGFDEDFPFWCADNSFLEQLKKIDEVPVLVTSSMVRHLGSMTLKQLDAKLQNELTKGQVKKFNRKYNQNLFNLGI